MASYPRTQASIDDHDDDPGADTGYYSYVPGNKTGAPISARKYSSSSTGTQRLRSAGQPASPTRPVRQTIDVVRNGDEMYYQSSYARPRRAPSTRDDPRVTTNLKPVPRPVSRRKLVFGGLGLVFGTLIVGSWGTNAIADIRQQMQEGAIPDASLELKCGHGDSDTHPTQLHAFLLKNNTISLVEYPGGDVTKEHIFCSDPILSSVPLSKWWVEIEPLMVDGKYQIQLSVTIPANGPFGQAVKPYWTFVDSGKGYFREAKSK